MAVIQPHRDRTHPAPTVPADAEGQRLRFTRSPDGVRIAHARHGSGPPLVVVACWLSHLQHDWQSPVWRHFLDDLGQFTTLIRYDLRGHGLSDWNVPDFSLDAHLRDLEAVIEAEGLDRFALMGMSGYSPLALAYAARHPERVTRLVLYGGLAGWPRDQTQADLDDEAAWMAMLRAGWNRSDARFRRVFTQGFIPDASEEQMAWFDNLQRMSTSTDNVLAARAARREMDLRDELARVTAPALVLHAEHDENVGFAFGRELAAELPDARLVPLESRNHILLADEPAWRVFVQEVRTFMEPDRSAVDADTGLVDTPNLTTRELEILRLAAEGLANGQIAEALTLSPRTIERHLSNAYTKLEVSGPGARAAAVASVIRSGRA